MVPEIMMTVVIQSFKRMTNPIEGSQQNFASEVTKEIKKIGIFQSVNRQLPIPQALL